ncbi:MAG: hypothetical protein ACPGSI_15300 [Pikeienuella sp.]
METVKVLNTTKSDLGLSEAHVVPAGGSIDVPVKAMEVLSENPVIQAWVEDGWLVDGDAKKKTKKRKGLEAQAAKLEVEFTDETSDDDLIAAIKMAKAAK